MSLKKYLLAMFVATGIAYLMFFVVIFYFDPLQSGFLGILFFYISLGLSLTGTFALLGLLVRIFFTKNKLMFRKVIDSFRQAILFSTAILFAMLLQRGGLLSPISFIFLILAITILELFFLTQHPKLRA